MNNFRRKNDKGRWPFRPTFAHRLMILRRLRRAHRKITLDFIVSVARFFKASVIG